MLPLVRLGVSPIGFLRILATSGVPLRRAPKSSASDEAVRSCGGALGRGTEDDWSRGRHDLSCLGVVYSTGELSWPDMEFRALDAALTDKADGRLSERSSELLVLPATSEKGDGMSRGVTSLLV